MKRYYSAFHFFSVQVCLLAVLLFFSLTLGETTRVFAVPDDESEAIDQSLAVDKTISYIWSVRMEALVDLEKEVAAHEVFIEEKLGPLLESVQDGQRSIGQLQKIYQASDRHPMEQIVLSRQMNNRFRQLSLAVAPLKSALTSVEAIKAELIKLQEGVSVLDAEMLNVGSAGENLDKLQNYDQNIKKLQKKLVRVESRLDKALVICTPVIESAKTGIIEAEEALGGMWQKYYLASISTPLDAISSITTSIPKWVKSLPSSALFTYPTNQKTLISMAESMGFCLVVFVLAGALAYFRSVLLPPHWTKVVRRVVVRSWVWVAMGFSILVACSVTAVNSYFGIILIGVLLVIWGMGALSWQLRRAALPQLAGQPVLFARLYPPAAIGVFMLYSNMPVDVTEIIWCVLMAMFIFMVFSMRQKQAATGTLPLLERILYGCSRYLGFLSILVALAGYPRLAILVFMFLFALTNTVTLASALMILAYIVSDKWLNKTEHPFSHALVQSVMIPVTWVVSLVCTIPWYWAVPGAKQIVEQVMLASYTFGDARFSFAKLLLILALYFLLRSFSRIGRTSLALLPKRLPGIEKGVIPPLQSLLGYGVWAFFAVIVLSLLGVSFTSLAVVAGGLSVGIGFGLQNIFNNLISGLMLIFGRTVLVGDYIEVGATAGTVHAISIRSTIIETVNMSLVYIPNSALMSGQFINWTRNNRQVRRTITVGVDYNSDLELVYSLLMETVQKQRHIMNIPAPTVRLENFGGSSLDLTLAVTIDEFNNSGDALADLRRDIREAFVTHNINIPFPQIDVHIPAAILPETARAMLNKATASDK